MSFSFWLIFFLSCLFFSGSIQAQTSDSLQDLSITNLAQLYQEKITKKAYKAAFPYAEKAMEKALERYGNQDTIYARMLFNYAYVVDYGLSDFKKAFDLHQKVAKIQEKKLGTSADYASTLLALADLYFYNFNEIEKAKTLYLQVKAMRKEVYGTTHDLYGIALNSLASFHSKLDQFKEAEAYYLQVQKIWLQNNGAMSQQHASILNNLAVLYFRTSQFKKAEEMYLKTLQIRKKQLGRLHPDYATALNNLAVLYKKIGKEDQAVEFYKEALDIRKKTLGEKHPYYASTLNNLAALYRKLGQLEEAEPLYLKAKDIKRNTLGEDHISYAYSLNSLALLYKELQKYEESVALLQQALHVFEEKLGIAHQDYIAVNNNLAIIYQRMGQDAAAEKIYLTLLTELRKKENLEKEKYSTVMTNLANLYHENKRPKEALVLMEEVVQIAEKNYGKEHPNYAAAINSYLATTEGVNSDEIEKNEALYFEALGIYEKNYGKDYYRYANAMSNLAGYYQEQNNDSLAYIYCMTAIAYSSTNFETIFPDFFSNKDHLIHVKSIPQYCCGLLAPKDYLKLSELKAQDIKTFNSAIEKLLINKKKAYKATKNKNTNETKRLLESIFFIGQAALQINEKVRNSFFSNTNKLLYLKKHNSTVEYGIESAILLEDMTFKEAAFGFVEQNKSILLADAAKGNRARNLGDLPDSLVLLELHLQAEKEALKKANSETKTAEERNEMVQKENALNAKIETFLNSLKDKFPKYHKLKYEQLVIEAQEVQRLLDKDALFLEYFVAEQRVYFFALTQESLEIFSVSIERRGLEQKIQDLRRCLSDFSFIKKKAKKAGNLYKETAYWFYNTLVAPALDGKTKTKLIVVADGNLGLLPFESFLTQLPTEAGDALDFGQLSYLLRDYSISYNYSAALFGETHQVNENRSLASKGMLACAASYPKQMDSSLLDLRMPHVVNWRKMLLPLPGAVQEVSNLEKQFEGDFLTGRAVNEAHFKKAAKNYSIIHLAMHGLLHPRLPMLSFLAFTEDQDSLEDNLLQAYEIARLQLKADLVVLSACETGSGAFQQGEGIISLARSFMYAGVPSLLVSLWSVNDQSAALIMQGFYHNLAQGLDKDLALRQAKLDFIEQVESKQQHPIFWSSFIQLGDSRPIHLIQKNGALSYWKYALGGLILLLIIGFFWRKNKRLV